MIWKCKNYFIPSIDTFLCDVRVVSNSELQILIDLHQSCFRCVWDLETQKKKQEFEAHNGDVCTLSLAPDSNTYITGSVDKTCKLWDVRDPTCKQVFFGHEGDVNNVCVSFISQIGKLIGNKTVRNVIEM